MRDSSLDAGTDAVGLLGWECTLLTHVQCFIHQNSQVILHRGALNPLFLQQFLILEVALTLVQDLVSGLVELHILLVKCLFHCSNGSSVVISHIATLMGYVVNFCLLIVLEEC